MFLSLTGCLLRQSDTNDQRDRADNLRKPVREPRRPRRFCWNRKAWSILYHPFTGKDTILKKVKFKKIYISNVKTWTTTLKHLQYGVRIMWDKGTRVYISLEPHFMGRVCGLCGNFDGNVLNDYKTRQGKFCDYIKAYDNTIYSFLKTLKRF